MIPNNQTESNGWMYLIVRGVQEDPQLSEFDTSYELTTYPAKLLWVPGSRLDARAWLEAAAPVGDEVDYLDRVFALHRHQGKISLPCLLLGLPEERRAGIWHLVRADFPGDSFTHIRHIEKGEPCGTQGHTGCAVHEIAQGSWEHATASVVKLFPGLQACVPSGTRVPRCWAFPDFVGS